MTTARRSGHHSRVDYPELAARTRRFTYGAPRAVSVSADGDRAMFLVDNARLDAVVRELAGLGVRSLVVAPPSLEELFLRHYGDELAAAGVAEP